jgi:hypothetical protein
MIAVLFVLSFQIRPKISHHRKLHHYGLKKMAQENSITSFFKEFKGSLSTACNNIIRKVENLVVKGNGKHLIKEFLDEACDLLDSPISDSCKSFIRSKLDGIINWIESGISTVDICKMIGLHDGKLEENFSIDILKAPLCNMCKGLIKQVEQNVLDGFGKSAINNLIKTACNKLPSFATTMCSSLLDNQVEKIMNFVKQGLSTTDICKKIKLC